MGPDCTIDPAIISGRKGQNTRFTCMTCCSADETDFLPLSFIGFSAKWRYLKNEYKKSGSSTKTNANSG